MVSDLDVKTVSAMIDTIIGTIANSINMINMFKLDFLFSFSILCELDYAYFLAQVGLLGYDSAYEAHHCNVDQDAEADQ